MHDKERRIRETAYFLWQEEGCPDNQADRHWQTAQAIVESQDDAQRKDIEGESPGEGALDYVTPFSTLKRSTTP